jgi:hypothetical protein
MKTKRRFTLVATGMFLVLSAASTLALTIGFSPVHRTVPLGSHPQVDLIATLGTTTPDLGGWDLMLSFDPTIISLDSVVFGTAFGTSSQDWDITNILLGQIRLTELSLEDASFFAGQPSSFTLATLTFSADNFGTSPLSLVEDEGGFTTGGADPITGAQLDPGSITVQDVPEGGNLAIVALPTLLGLLFLGKRAQNAKR